VTRTWESAERRTRPTKSDIDGVGIVAILEKETGPEIVLQKQYRPPIDKIVIEIPAGLVDEGETAEEAAIRELKEETGYVVGKVLETTPVMWNGQSLSVSVSVSLSLSLSLCLYFCSRCRGEKERRVKKRS